MPKRVTRYLSDMADLARSQTAFQTGFVLGGNLTSAFLRFVVSMALAHVLPIDAWGYLVVFIAVMDLAAIAAESGLNATLVKFIAARSDRNPAPLVRRALAIKAALIALVCVAAALLANPFFRTQQMPDGLRWLYPAAVAAGILLSLNTLGNAVLQGRQRYRLFALLTPLTNVVRVALMGAMAFAGLTAMQSLSAAFFAGPALALPIVILVVGVHLRRWNTGEPADVPAGDMIRFMAPLTLLGFVTILLQRLDILLVKSLSGTEEVAVYGLAYQIAFVFPLITASVFATLLPKIAGMKKRAELRAYRNRVLQLYPVILVLAAVAAWVMPYFITLVFGERYEAAEPVLRLLVLALGLHIVYNPIGLIFYALDRPMNVALIHIVQLPVLVGLDFWFIPIWGAWGAAVAGLIIRIGGVAAILTWTAHALRQDQEDQHEPA